MSITDRQDELVNTLAAIIDADLPYVLIGGWAVSAVGMERFTTDVDIVAPRSAVDEYEVVLDNREYTKCSESQTAPLYLGTVIRFQKDVGNPVEFDLMIDSLGCRQTDAEWSYRYLHQHSQRSKLDFGGGINVRIPEPELLFAVKLHSGRMADARDLVVLAQQSDFDRIEKHIHRGKSEKLANQIEIVIDRVTAEGFADSFKGVFQQHSLPEEDIRELVDFLGNQREQLV